MERQYFSMALRGDGRLYTWGSGGSGQLGAGGWGDDPLPNNVDSGYRVPTL
jgi:alpha-tubulin suppressor-like RCC1 family protein